MGMINLYRLNELPFLSHYTTEEKAPEISYPFELKGCTYANKNVGGFFARKGMIDNL